MNIELYGNTSSLGLLANKLSLEGHDIQWTLAPRGQKRYRPYKISSKNRTEIINLFSQSGNTADLKCLIDSQSVESYEIIEGASIASRSQSLEQLKLYWVDSNSLDESMIRTAQKNNITLLEKEIVPVHTWDKNALRIYDCDVSCFDLWSRAHFFSQPGSARTFITELVLQNTHKNIQEKHHLFHSDNVSVHIEPLNRQSCSMTLISKSRFQINQFLRKAEKARSSIPMFLKLLISSNPSAKRHDYSFYEGLNGFYCSGAVTLGRLIGRLNHNANLDYDYELTRSLKTFEELKSQLSTENFNILKLTEEHYKNEKNAFEKKQKNLKIWDRLTQTPIKQNTFLRVSQYMPQIVKDFTDCPF